MVYPTVQIAARELGVSDETVRNAVLRGTLDRVGLHLRGRIAAPVRIRGQVFASAQAAARHFGLSEAAIYYAIEEGREDRVGLGRPPLVLFGVTFASKQEAARRLGLRPSYVRDAERRNSAVMLARIEAAIRLMQVPERRMAA